ncbi:MAG: flagellar protein FlaG [Firmicutes bacterium]|nr:flagellar protein FlaG [Bacillota bacterium]
MIEPIGRTTEIDTTKYNDYSSSSNQKKSLETERHAQQIAKQKEVPLKKNEASDEENNTLNNPQEQTNKVGFDGIGEKLLEITGMTQVYFQFELCEKTKKDLIMKTIDKETHEVIQQYPTEVSLKIAQMIQEQLGRGQIANATV